MMRVLIIKTSSLGDVLNTLPALTDAGKVYPEIQFDWVVEPAFAEVPGWHQYIKQVIPAALRRWRKQPWQAWHSGEWQQFQQQLRATTYDYVIDAQGLLKSAFLTLFARGPRCGYDFRSAWESLASLAYQRRFAVKPQQHAITRIRQLFARSLGYPAPEDFPECGIDKSLLLKPAGYTQPYCVFMHGTARTEKCWPENHWQALITLMKNTPYRILLPWGNPTEQQRAERLAADRTHVTVLPKSSLTELAAILAYAKFNVAVDTGPGHLSAALDVPTVSLYGPTYPELNGTLGHQQIHIKMASLADITPEKVWQALSVWV